MKFNRTIEIIKSCELDDKLALLYGPDNLEGAKERYIEAVNKFCSIYGKKREIGIYTVSGRSELSGNHTDHNNGCVIAASISQDIIAVASPVSDDTVRVYSEGFGEDTVDLSRYTSPREELLGTSASIIAGVIAGFKQAGHKTGGFVAYVSSDVLVGSGLSSSAAFENIIGTIENHLYNDGLISSIEIAKISQYSENVFFGKPCGLMDQIACAVGGIVAIDFEDTKNPVVNKIDFDISKEGYALCIVNTGGSHADLTDDYASIPQEMKSVAEFFGKKSLREVDERELYSRLPDIRTELGDRAVLRALHFFDENRRVSEQKRALLSGEFDMFLQNAVASGKSSFCYLQNAYPNKNPSEQGISLAICLSEKILGNKKAAFRVHGGGFAGTVQAFVPKNLVEEYKNKMEACFGEGTCSVLFIRPVGAARII